MTEWTYEFKEGFKAGELAAKYPATILTKEALEYAYPAAYVNGYFRGFAEMKEDLAA